MLFINKISKREKTALYLGAGILFLLFLDRFIFSPINRKIARLNQEIKINQTRLANDLRNIQHKDAIISEYNKYKAYVKKAGSDEEETAKTLGEIENVARSSSVYLMDIKPQAPKQTEFYKKYSAEVEIEGQMNDIINFLYKLNSSPQLLRTEKVSLTPKEKNSEVAKALILVSKFLIP